jgi:hypothetical protein
MILLLLLRFMTAVQSMSDIQVYLFSLFQLCIELDAQLEPGFEMIALHICDVIYDVMWRHVAPRLTGWSTRHKSVGGSHNYNFSIFSNQL